MKTAYYKMMADKENDRQVSVSFLRLGVFCMVFHWKPAKSPDYDKIMRQEAERRWGYNSGL